MSQMMIGSMNGSIYVLDTDIGELVLYDKPDDKGIMGLARHGGYLFISSREMIIKERYLLEEADWYPESEDPLCLKFPKESPQFHQMMIHHGEIYLTCTLLNEIWVFNSELKLLGKRTIKPPNPCRPISLKTNYNHINSICFHDDRFYVGLNWLTSKQYGKSGVCVLDTKLRELRRFEYGWETHGFTFIDGKQYALCASSKLKGREIKHPIIAGLMVEGEIVFEHSTDVFCKAFVVSNDRIYLLGGDVAPRENRGTSRGFIYTLDGEFNLLDTMRFEGTGQFCGGILL